MVERRMAELQETLKRGRMEEEEARQELVLTRSVEEIGDAEIAIVRASSFFSLLRLEAWNQEAGSERRRPASEVRK